MRELLLRYLMGDLSDAERADFQAKLACDSALRAELDRLRGAMCPDELDAAGGERLAPAGLAERCVARCAQVSQCGEPLRSCSSMTLVDAGVAAGVVLAVSLMMAPALRESRDRARRLACQDNLGQLGVALIQYANDHNGYFPAVRPDENAGIFAVRLANEDYLQREDLARLLNCPGAAVSDAEHCTAGNRVPTPEELLSAGGSLLVQLRRAMGGSYAYRLGYVENGRYYAVRNFSNCRSPMLADAPAQGEGGWRSFHHGVCGQNVLFQDGSVRYVFDCRLPEANEQIFVNVVGKTAAGLGWSDFVLVRSEIMPGVPSATFSAPRAIYRPLSSSR